MPEHAAAGWLLLAAILSGFAGMGWLALSMRVHAAQTWDRAPTTGTLRVLRWMGCAAVVVALLLCLGADHATMAVLVWMMALSGAAFLVAFLLASHAGWLRWLAPWVHPGALDSRDTHPDRAGM